MTKDDVRLLCAYDHWATDRTLRAASELTAEQFTRDLGGSFSSVRDTLAHIIGGKWIWLAYWRERSPSKAFVTALRVQRDELFDPTAFPDVRAIQVRWGEVEREQAKFLDRLTDESLQDPISFRGKQAPLVHLIQHVVNHATYHRGQVSLMLRQLGAAPLATDFHEFLAAAPTEA